MTETYTAPESLLKNVPPHSLDAERAVLGAMLIDPRAIDDVAEVVTPEHFYKAAHAAIYTVILELYKLNQPVDVVLVNEELQKRGELDKVGGTTALVELTETVPTSANAAYYAEVVRDYACRRQLIQVVAEIQRDTFEDRGQTEELLDRTERRLFEVTQKRIRSEAVPVSSVVQEAFERLELVRKGGGVVGQPSGLSDLDDLTQGFQPGEMTILAARPSMGKCLAWDTEVLLADGRLMTMAEVYAAGRAGTDAVQLLTLGADWRFRAVEPSAWVDDGQKPVFRVTTRLGREIETTLTHPFLTPGGWRPLGELAVGTRVAVPRRLEVFGDQPVAARELDRLAAVLAEGGELPPRAFSLPREQLRELLGPILAGALPPAWSRERPARQVQHLLLRFGVLSALGEDRGEWRLSLVEDDGGELTEATDSRRGGVVTARSTQVYWDTIAAIEPAGLKQVYDLTVPETHNFVAADVCVHNTTLALNILRNVTVYHGRSAVFFSLEMPRLQVTTNLLCGLAKIDGHRLRGGYLTREEERQFLDAAEVLMPAQLYIDDTPGLSTMDLRAKARRLKAQKGIDLIMIDYLQLMSGSAVAARESRQQEVSEISRMTKALARELNIPIIALAQLSRKVEERKDHKPMMSDLRESGCLTGESLVTLGDGRRVPIRDLVGRRNFPVWALDTDSLQLVQAKATRAFSTGVKPVSRLRTALGRELRATGNHRFFTVDGWKRLDELVPGDCVALPRRIPTPEGQGSLRETELGLLGHLIGDGCTLPRRTVQYTTRERELADEVVKLATSTFGDSVKPRIVEERTWLQVYLPTTRKLTHGVRSPVAEWLEAHGAWGRRSYQKRVPEQVFSQPRAAIAGFLRHLWATDGCVHVPQGARPGYPAIYYATSSAGLARDVQSLLLRVEINAGLHQVPQARGRVQYHVVVSGRDDAVRFAEVVGAVGSRRKAALESARARVSAGRANTNRDVVPASVWQKYALPALKARGLSHRGFQAALGMSYCGQGLYRQNLSRERARRVATVAGSVALERLAGSDVYWDRIVEIAPDGREEVFDLTVPGPHNFIANEVVVHNSIEQDADLIMLLHRPGYYEPEKEELKNQALLIVAKNRNGPIGEVPLLFFNNQMRFESSTRG